MSQLIYPLSTTQPDYAVAANLIASQQDILSYVIQTLAQYVDASLSNQQQAIDAVTRVLQASARGRVAANGRRINPVVDCLGTCAAVAVAEDSIQANRAAASVGCPCEPPTAPPTAPSTQPGIPRGVDGELGTAEPAIEIDGTGEQPSTPSPPALPPGCVPLALRDNQSLLLYPSGYPAQDLFVNRSAALGYFDAMGGIRTYFSVPSATGPTLIPPSILVGYYDIPAGFVPYSTNPSSPPTTLCPVNQTGPPTPQPPPGSVVQWYCARTRTGVQEVFSHAGLLPQAIRDAYERIDGPFATEQQARDLCFSTLPGSDPYRGQWWCVHATDSLGLDIYNVAAFASEEAVVAAAWEPFAGPFETKAQAEYACANRIPNPTPPGPPVKCPTFSLPSLPQWCSTNVCDTIDAITAAVKGAGTIDLFKALDAGTRDNIGPEGTWLGDVRKITVVGESLYGFVSLVLCAIGETANAILASTDSQAPAMLVANSAALLTGFLEKWLGTGFTDIHRRVNYWADYQSPAIIPTVAEADAAYVRGFIDEKQWRCWVRANNVCDEPHKQIVEAQYLKPSWSQAERLWRIGAINDEDLTNYYAHSGIADPVDRTMFRELYTQYPDFDAVISFMVRDVFDPVAVAAGGLDQEFAEKYTDEAEKYGSITGLSRDLAKLYWMSHWRQPTTTELFTMLHRLRPGVVADDIVVTSEAIAKQLGVNDIAPAWRKKLMEISYHSVSIRQARQFYQNEVINEDGVEGIYLNQGYIPAQAKLAAQNETIVKRRALAQLFKGWTPAAIALAYAGGKMDAAEVDDQLKYLGANKQQIDDLMRRAKIDRAAKLQFRAESRAITTSWTTILRAYQTGSVDRVSAQSFLLQYGWSESSATLALDAEDVRSRQKVVDQGIRAVKQAYLTGVVTAFAVPTLLTSIGVSQPRAQEYLVAWTLLLTPRRKVLSGQQALRLYSEALLDEPTVRQRLANLGWADPDLTLLILEARNKRLTAEARAAKAAERERIQAAALLEKEIKEQQALLKQTQSRLCGMVSVSRLIKWYANRWISQSYLITRLRYCGYTEDVIGGYIFEAEQARNKVNAAAAKEADAVGSNGSPTA